MNYRLLAAALAVLFSGTASATPSHVTYGVGSQSCAAWITGVDQNNPEAIARGKTWLAGFITAYNAVAAARTPFANGVVNLVTVDGMFAAVSARCRYFAPEESVDAAAENIIARHLH